MSQLEGNDLSDFLAHIKKQVKQQEICLLSFIGAVALLKFPLQHHITLARFQHYGLCLYVWALGFILQTIWSWRYLSIRGRASLLATGFYIGTFALIFYESPWLDTRMAVQTDEQDILRVVYALTCAVLGFIVSGLWLAWVIERKKAPEKETTP